MSSEDNNVFRDFINNLDTEHTPNPDFGQKLEYTVYAYRDLILAQDLYTSITPHGDYTRVNSRDTSDLVSGLHIARAQLAVYVDPSPVLKDIKRRSRILDADNQAQIDMNIALIEAQAGYMLNAQENIELALSKDKSSSIFEGLLGVIQIQLDNDDDRVRNTIEHALWLLDKYPSLLRENTYERIVFLQRQLLGVDAHEPKPESLEEDLLTRIQKEGHFDSSLPLKISNYRSYANEGEQLFFDIEMPSDDPDTQLPIHTIIELLSLRAMDNSSRGLNFAEIGSLESTESVNADDRTGSLALEISLNRSSQYDYGLILQKMTGVYNDPSSRQLIRELVKKVSPSLISEIAGIKPDKILDDLDEDPYNTLLNLFDIISTLSPLSGKAIEKWLKSKDKNAYYSSDTRKIRAERISRHDASLSHFIFLAQEFLNQSQ